MIEFIILTALVALLMLALEPSHRRALHQPDGSDRSRVSAELRAAQQHLARLI